MLAPVICCSLLPARLPHASAVPAPRSCIISLPLAVSNPRRAVAPDSFNKSRVKFKQNCAGLLEAFAKDFEAAKAKYDKSIAVTSAALAHYRAAVWHFCRGSTLHFPAAVHPLKTGW